MIVILYAMEEEVAGLQAALLGPREQKIGWAAFTTGVINGEKVALVKTGAGKTLATMTAQHVINTLAPRLILLTGISGALNPGYERGDMVIGKDFIQHDIVTEVFGFERGQIPFTDYKIIGSSQSLAEMAATLKLDDARVWSGRVLSGDQFISGGAGRALREEFAGDVVDMESAAVALVCHINKVPFVIARTISDKADESAAKDFAAFLTQASKHVTSFVLHMIAVWKAV